MKSTSRKWSRLDNAAKIFPPTTTARDPKVFRFACELYEEVEPDVLQRALDRTLERFSYYRSVLKKGLFWYYFEETGAQALVSEEVNPPCSPRYLPNRKQLLFEVTYFGRRINLEVFHALSDGTGALQFLRVLVGYYLSERHADELGPRVPDVGYDASDSQMAADSFAKYHSRVRVRRKKSPRAYLLRGDSLPENRLGVIEAIVPVGSVLPAAKAQGATVTQFLTALLVHSIHGEMSLREEKRPVVVSIPANLRNFFPSESSRNFFCIVNVRHDFSTQGTSFGEVLSNIKNEFTTLLTPENVTSAMNTYTSLGSNIATKLAPLVLKIPVLRIANRFSDSLVTAGLSNVGRVEMPEPYVKYIRLFDVFSSTGKLQLCMSSFRDNMVITFTSHLAGTEVQRRFVRALTALGIPAEVHSNLNELRKLR